jgi:hypothetical protein
VKLSLGNVKKQAKLRFAIYIKEKELVKLMIPDSIQFGKYTVEPKSYRYPRV